MSSRLFQEIREREGLVYAIHSGVQAYVDTGILYIYAATDEKNFSKVLKSTLKVLRELKKTGVTEDELRRAKDHLKGSLMLSLESTSSRMNRLAKHEMHHGTFLSMDAMLAAIDGVRHEEVQGLVTEHLDEDRLALTTLGPWTGGTCPESSCTTRPASSPFPVRSGGSLYAHDLSHRFRCRAAARRR